VTEEEINRKSASEGGRNRRVESVFKTRSQIERRVETGLYGARIGQKIAQQRWKAREADKT